MKKTVLIAALFLLGNQMISLADNYSFNSENIYLCQNKKSNDSNSVNFTSPDSVLGWLSGKTFYSDGVSVKFSFNAVYVNGTAVTAAPIVKRFTSTTATIEAHSPYLGMSAMTFYIDAARGTVTQAGDVYTLKQ